MSGFRFYPRRGKGRTYRPEGRTPNSELRTPNSELRTPNSNQPDLEDARRAEFIIALDGADFELDEWAAEFTGSMFLRVDRGHPFTEKMRVQIDKLISAHGHRVEWPGRPEAKHPVRSKTREATPKPEI